MTLDYLTSELESADLFVRFLLTTLELFRVEYITVGVIVREFVLSLIVGEAWDRSVVDEELILTGDFGSNGKNEYALLIVGLGTLTTLGKGARSAEDDVLFALLVICGDGFVIPVVVRVIGFWGLTRITPWRSSRGSIVLDGGWGFTKPLLFLKWTNIQM